MNGKGPASPSGQHTLVFASYRSEKPVIFWTHLHPSFSADKTDHPQVYAVVVPR